MSFDPTLPQENTPLDAAQMRNQFTGLKTLLDALQSLNAAQIAAVNTLPPDDPANVTVSVTGSTLHFTFDIPQGNDGPAGSDGGDGPQGPPFANAVVDSVTTLDPGMDATVDVNFDGTDVHLTFGIPRGSDGNDGAEGPSGSDGAPGEVSQQTLDDAIADTSRSSNAVDTLGMVVTDPPTQSEMQQLADKLDELINALRR